MHWNLLLECVINNSNFFILELGNKFLQLFSTTFYPFVLFVYTGIEWHTINFLNLHVP